MGSRGYQRLFRRARAEIRRRRREAHFGAACAIVTDLQEAIDKRHQRQLAAQMFPGLDGLLLNDEATWPAVVECFHPPRTGNGLYVGTVGGRSRA